MKSTGIVRQIDQLGRIVIPKELRRVFNISEKDSLEIYTDENMIVLKKYEPACLFCQSMQDLVSFKGHCICRDCLQKMNDVAGQE